MADLATLVIKVDSTDARSATKDVDRLAEAGIKADKYLSGMAKNAAALLATYGLTKAISEVTTLAARYETMGVVMGVAGANAGYSRVEMALLEEELQKTGISALQSRNSLTNLATANIDLADATKLARAAQDVAVVGNLNSSESLERMIHGIKSGQTEVLRTMGINVQFEEGYRQMAQTLGKNTEQLTNQEKQQSRVNLVLAEASKYAGIYDASMGTAGKQAKSMERYLQDLETQAGETFQPAYSSIVQSLTLALKGSSEWLDENRVDAAALGLSLSSTVSTMGDAAAMLGQMAVGANNSADALSGLKDITDGVGLGVSILADSMRTAVAGFKLAQGIQTGGLIGDFLGGDTAYKEGMALLNQESSLARYEKRLQENEAKALEVRTRVEQIATIKASLDEVTNAYDRLSAAMAKVPNPSPADQDALNSTALQRDMLRAQLAQVQKNLPIEYGPIFSQTTRTDQPDTGATARDYQRQADFVRDLAREMSELGKSEREVLMLRVEQAKLTPSMEMVALNIANQLAGRKALLEVEGELAKLKPPTEEQYIENTPFNRSDYAALDAARDLKKYAEDLNDRYQDKTVRMEAEVLKLNTALAQGRISLDTYRMALIDLQAAQDNVWTNMGDVIQNYADDASRVMANWMNGVSAGHKQMFSSMLQDMQAYIIKQQVMMPLFRGISGGLGTMGDGGGWGSFFTAFANAWGGGKASGGYVDPSSWYLVGERGPELFVPGTSGSIVPNHAIRNGNAGGSGETFNLTINVQADGDTSMAGLPQSPRMQELGRNVKELVLHTIREEQRLTGSLRPVF